MLPAGVSPAAGCTSDVAAELAQLAKPRYHFAAGHDCFFARLPYANKDLGAGPRATRFIGLAPAGSASECLCQCSHFQWCKWLRASSGWPPRAAPVKCCSSCHPLLHGLPLATVGSSCMHMIHTLVFHTQASRNRCMR